VKGEPFDASIKRHQHYIAARLGLAPGMRVLDAVPFEVDRAMAWLVHPRRLLNGPSRSLRPRREFPQNAPKGRLRGKTHSSICVQEGDGRDPVELSLEVALEELAAAGRDYCAALESPGSQKIVFRKERRFDSDHPHHADIGGLKSRAVRASGTSDFAKRSARKTAT
jgi:hypothetical protein